MIDIFGYIGMGLVLYSFTTESIRKLRFINSIGCGFWIVYGIGITAPPTIIVNSCLLGIHLYWFHRHRRKPKSGIHKDDYNWYGDGEIR